MEQLSPIPPKAMMKARRSKSTPFWHHWNGGRGGPGVPFILSKIVGSISAALSCLAYPPLLRGRSAGSFPEQRLVIEARAQPGRAKEESRITCMRMLRTPPFFAPNRGRNHIWKYFPDLACDAIFWMIIYKQQFLHSDWLKTCQLILNQWNFTRARLKPL